MNCWDFVTSGVKKKCHETLAIWSSSDALDVSACPSSSFNLSLYNSSDQWLRLKCYKMDCHPIKVRCVPPHLSEDRRLQLSRVVGCSTFCHVTWGEKDSPTWRKWWWFDEYISKAWLMRQRKSWKLCLFSLITYTRDTSLHTRTKACTRAHKRAHTHTHTLTHTHTHVHVCDTWRVSYAAILSVPCQLPRQHVIKI